MEKSNKADNNFNKAIKNYNTINSKQHNNNTLNNSNVTIKSNINEIKTWNYVFLLAITSIGSGCLALPNKFQYTGIFFTIVFMIYCCYTSYLTSYILIKVGHDHKQCNYSGLVRKLLGRKHEIFHFIALTSNIYGVVIVYQIIMFELINSLINLTKFRIYIMYANFIFILFPLSLFQDVSKLKPASIIGIFSIFYLIITIIIQCPRYISNYDNLNSFENNVGHLFQNFSNNATQINVDINNNNNDISNSTNFKKISNIYLSSKKSIWSYYNIYNIDMSLTKNLMIFISFANIMFTFNFHVNALNIYNKIGQHKTKNLGKQILIKTTIFLLIIYLVIGLFGYITQPINTPDLIFKRYSIYNKDTYMDLAKGFLIITIICKIPIFYNGLKVTYYQYFYKSEIVSNSINLKFTFISLLINTTISVIYSDIDDYITILGGYSSVTVCFMYPMLLYLRNYELIHSKKIILKKETKRYNSKTVLNISEDSKLNKNYNNNIIIEANNQTFNSKNSDLISDNTDISYSKYNYNSLILIKEMYLKNKYLITSCSFLIVIGYASCIVIMIKVLK